MKINVIKRGSYYIADCCDLPGTPPLGVGETSELALAHLFYMIMFGSTGGQHPKVWMSYIDEKKPIVVNGQEWDVPEDDNDGR